MSAAPDFLLLSRRCPDIAAAWFCVAEDLPRALDVLSNLPITAVIVDLDDAGLMPLQCLDVLRIVGRYENLFAISSQADASLQAEACSAGADQVMHVSSDLSAENLSDLASTLHRTHTATQTLCPQIRSAQDFAVSLAALGRHLLIHGEIGTGRSHLARLILARPSSPAVAEFNASDCPKNRQTGVLRDLLAEKPSRLILREIEHLSMSAQKVLLKGLDMDSGPVQVLATSTLGAQDLLQGGCIDPDLGLLLTQHSVHLPSLRERAGDIRYLSRHFAAIARGPDAWLAADTLSALAAYPWPGNVAELRQTIFRMLESSPSFPVQVDLLPAEVFRHAFYRQFPDLRDVQIVGYHRAKRAALDSFHKNYLASLTARARGNLTVAAEMAGMDRSNFKKIVRKYRRLLT